MRTNKYSGTNDCRPASTEGPVEHDGQRFVGDDVTQQQRDQDPMLAALEQLEHLFRVFALVFLARRSKDLEVDFVLAHEAGRQLSATGAQTAGRGQTHAMVRPAKTPPARTKATAMPRNSQSWGSSAPLGRSSSAWWSWWRAIAAPPKGMGSAATMGAKAWQRPIKARRAMRRDEPLGIRRGEALMAMAIARKMQAPGRGGGGVDEGWLRLRGSEENWLRKRLCGGCTNNPSGSSGLGGPCASHGRP